MLVVSLFSVTTFIRAARLAWVRSDLTVMTFAISAHSKLRLSAETLVIFWLNVTFGNNWTIPQIELNCMLDEIGWLILDNLVHEVLEQVRFILSVFLKLPPLSTLQDNFLIQTEEVYAKLFQIMRVVSMSNYHNLQHIRAWDVLLDILLAHLLKPRQHEVVSVDHQGDEVLNVVLSNNEVVRVDILNDVCEV